MNLKETEPGVTTCDKRIGLQRFMIMIFRNGIPWFCYLQLQGIRIWCMQQVALNHWHILTNLHDLTTQRTVILMFCKSLIQVSSKILVLLSQYISKWNTQKWTQIPNWIWIHEVSWKTNDRLIFIPFQHFIQRTQKQFTQKINFTVKLLTFIKTRFKIWIRIILHKQAFCFITVEGDFRSLSSQQINKPEKVNDNSKSHD